MLCHIQQVFQESNIANMPQGMDITAAWLKRSAADLLKVSHEDVPLETWRQAREAVVQEVTSGHRVAENAWLESFRSDLNNIRRDKEVTIPQSDAEHVIWSALYYTVPSEAVRGERFVDYLANAIWQIFSTANATQALHFRTPLAIGLFTATRSIRSLQHWYSRPSLTSSRNGRCPMMAAGECIVLL